MRERNPGHCCPIEICVRQSGSKRRLLSLRCIFPERLRFSMRTPVCTRWIVIVMQVSRWEAEKSVANLTLFSEIR